jgi:hypothetical protein
MSPAKPKKALPFSRIPGITDDVLNRFEFSVSDAAMAKAVNKASINTRLAPSNFETSTLHGYMDKLDDCKKLLIKRIMAIANESMEGIQLQAFLYSFQYGINKCVAARTMKVSRQSIQIRNKRAIRKIKKIIFTDPKCLVLIAEMQRLRRKISELD